MPSIQDDLKQLEVRIAERLKQLRPLVEEYEELLQLGERLGALSDADIAAARARLTSESSRRTSGRGTRRLTESTQATGAKRRKRILALIAERPGIKASEIGVEIGVGSAQINRVVRRLLAEGLVEKEGPKISLARRSPTGPPVSPS